MRICKRVPAAIIVRVAICSAILAVSESAGGSRGSGLVGSTADDGGVGCATDGRVCTTVRCARCRVAGRVVLAATVLALAGITGITNEACIGAASPSASGSRGPAIVFGAASLPLGSVLRPPFGPPSLGGARKRDHSITIRAGPSPICVVRVDGLLFALCLGRRVRPRRCGIMIAARGSVRLAGTKQVGGIGVVSIVACRCSRRGSCQVQQRRRRRRQNRLAHNTVVSTVSGMKRCRQSRIGRCHWHARYSSWRIAPGPAVLDATACIMVHAGTPTIRATATECRSACSAAAAAS